jgi:polysaccharide biosynthesis protein PslE
MESIDSRHSSFRDFLHVIFKHKILMLTFFLVTVCLVTAAAYLITPSYEAYTRFFVKFDRDNLYVPSSGARSTYVSLNEQVNSEIELLKSNTLIGNVAKSLGPNTIYPEPDYRRVVAKLAKAIKIARVKKSNIISASFKHTDPEMAANVLNTLGQEYLEYNLQIYKSSESYDFFKEQSQILAAKLTRSEKDLESFKRRHQVTDLAQEQQLLLTQIANLRSETNQDMGRMAEVASRIAQLSQQLIKTPATISIGAEVEHNPALISDFETRLMDLELKQKELTAKYAPKNRLVKNVKQEILLVTAKLAELQTRRFGKSQTGLNATYQRIKEELFKDQAGQKALIGKNKTQKAQLTGLRQKLDHLNRIANELSQLKQSVDVNRQNYRLYLSRFEEARIAHAMDTKKIANVSLIEPARPPLKPVSPKRRLIFIFGVLVGGLGGIGLAFLKEYLDDSLEKPEDVEQTLKVPVLASIPQLATKG